jgi:type I restriction enzyme S subunit
MYPVKTFLTMAFAFIENNQLINKIYLYYYLKSIEQHLISLRKGTAQPCISMDKLKSIKIPIPSLDKQKEIVEYCEYNDTLIKQLEKEIENNKKQAHQFMSSIVKSSKVSEDNDDASLVNTDSIDDAQETLSIVEEEEEEIGIE